MNLELDHQSVYRLDPEPDGEWQITRVTYDTSKPNSILISLISSGFTSPKANMVMETHENCELTRSMMTGRLEHTTSCIISTRTGVSMECVWIPTATSLQPQAGR